MKNLIAMAFICAALLCAVDLAHASPTVATNDTSVTLLATNGFGVQFALTEDEKIFADWDKPVAPTFKPVAVARRGVPIFTVVIFAGAGRRSDGTADVTFDAVVRKPDGSVYGRNADLVGVQGRIDPSPKALQLCRDYMGVRIEPQDPAGTYTAEVVVRDNVKKLELHATRTFTVEK